MLDFEAVNEAGGDALDGRSPLVHRDIIVIGASAGGVEATSEIARALPANFPGAVFIVVHIAPTATSLLPTILTRRGALVARHPNDGDPIEPGTIYVAPPDRHLMIERGRIRIVRGPMENGTRPAVDPLFRSAATAYGARVVGVVLSGNLDDGTSGLMAIKRCGGLAIVQDPDDALFPGMPQSAIDHVAVDRIVPLEAIPEAIIAATGEQVNENAPCRDARFLKKEVQMVEFDENIFTPEGPPPLPRGEESEWIARVVDGLGERGCAGARGARLGASSLWLGEGRLLHRSSGYWLAGQFQKTIVRSPSRRTRSSR